MSEFMNISAALDGKLNDMAGLPSVAWENKAFKPTKGTLYIRPTLLPGDTVGATVGSAGTDEHVGIYQVDVMGDSGKGKNAAMVMADKIADQFKPVTELTYSGTVVRCVSVSRGAAKIDDDRYMIPVTVTYLSFTTKR